MTLNEYQEVVRKLVRYATTRVRSYFGGRLLIGLFRGRRQWLDSGYFISAHAYRAVFVCIPFLEVIVVIGWREETEQRRRNIQKLGGEIPQNDEHGSAD